MAIRHFTVNSAADWGVLAVELEQYAKELEPKIVRVVERTAEVGRSEAFFLYHSNTYGGNENVSVSVEENGKAQRDVTARGSDVVFNEFGAGVETDSSHPYSAVIGAPVAPGSWSSSDQGSGMFAKRGFWYWKNHKFVGLHPSRAMYNAAQKMKSEMSKIVKEVFR